MNSQELDKQQVREIILKNELPSEVDPMTFLLAIENETGSMVAESLKYILANVYKNEPYLLALSHAMVTNEQDRNWNINLTKRNHLDQAIASQILQPSHPVDTAALLFSFTGPTKENEKDLLEYIGIDDGWRAILTQNLYFQETAGVLGLHPVLNEILMSQIWEQPYIAKLIENGTIVNGDGLLNNPEPRYHAAHELSRLQKFYPQVKYQGASR